MPAIIALKLVAEVQKYNLQRWFSFEVFNGIISLKQIDFML